MVECLRKRQNTLQKRAQLWRPFSRTMQLAGIRSESLPPDSTGGQEQAGEAIARTPEAMAAALRAHWGPIFSAKMVPQEKLDEFLDRVGVRFPEAPLPIPSEADVRFALTKARPSAPGPDGLSYRAWRAVPQQVTVLHNLLLHLFAGHHVPEHLNDSIFAFLAKGTEPTDVLDCVRSPGATRPLSLRNTDTKVLASAANRHLKPLVSERVHDVQKGFVSGRNFCANIASLDARARIESQRPAAATDCPVLATYDVAAAAFPSLGHQWLFNQLRRVGLPDGYLHVIRALYHLPMAYARFGGCVIPMFFLLSGVLQGCPLSGSAWAFAMDPILRALVAAVHFPPLVLILVKLGGAPTISGWCCHSCAC